MVYITWQLVLTYLGKYFDEISQDTGRFCFSVEDTMKALEMGAVETLILWENLDVGRFTLKERDVEATTVSFYLVPHHLLLPFAPPLPWWMETNSFRSST